MTNYSEEHRKILSQAAASWFVRRDGKYFELDNLNVALSRTDAQQICIERFGDEFSHIVPSNDLLRDVMRATFTSLTGATDERIATWLGQVACVPNSTDRLIRQRGCLTSAPTGQI